MVGRGNKRMPWTECQRRPRATKQSAWGQTWPAIMKKNPSTAKILPAWLETVATPGQAFCNINPITVKVKPKTTVAATMVNMNEDKAGEESTPCGWNRKVIRAKAAS